VKPTELRPSYGRSRWKRMADRRSRHRPSRSVSTAPTLGGFGPVFDCRRAPSASPIVVWRIGPFLSHFSNCREGATKLVGASTDYALSTLQSGCGPNKRCTLRDEYPQAFIFLGCPSLNRRWTHCYLLAGCSSEGFEYTGTLPISRPWSLIIATWRSGSSLGVSSETPMASTAALSIASVSSSQTNPDLSKSRWPSATSKK
jgi:hypothetical protein